MAISKIRIGEVKDKFWRNIEIWNEELQAFIECTYDIQSYECEDLFGTCEVGKTLEVSTKEVE
jgi:hypothetical protein